MGQRLSKTFDEVRGTLVAGKDCLRSACSQRVQSASRVSVENAPQRVNPNSTPDSLKSAGMGRPEGRV